VIVTLTTDFGTADGYAGEMKGVILAGCPEVRLVDITHDVPRGDIEAGARVLARIWDRYPADTVHVAVVDPGVGSSRRGIAAAAGGNWFVGPDNGLLTLVTHGHAVDEVRNLGASERPIGDTAPTFHGRDVFAPAAARLAAGADPDDLGELLPTDELILLPIPAPERLAGLIRGRVAHVDRFGNLATDVRAEWLTGDRFLVEIGDATIRGPARTYADGRSGEVLVLIGSDGSLEIAVRGGSAAERLSATRGTAVVVRTTG